MPKSILVNALCNREGYPIREARKLVDQVFQVIRECLAEGKAVEIEGLGTITLTRQRSYRRVSRLKGHPVSIYTISKRPIGIKFKADKKLKLEE